MNRALLALLLATNLLLWGQSAAPVQQPADGTYDAGSDPGPNRGVARLSLLNGDVSVRRGDSGDVVAAAANAPVMVQDSLLTSSSSRAEVQFDPDTLVRVGANGEVRFSDINNRSYQLQLAIGTITFRVFRPGSQSEIDTPSVAVRPLQPGSYRVTVHEDGSSEITVRDGEAEIASANGIQRLGSSQTMLVRGTPQEAEFQTHAAAPLDAWDRWNLDRDRVFENSRSSQYLGPDVPGAEQLDNNGRWVTDPTYGQVWAPNTTDPNWAPYRNGDWTWEDYYGWTWVSADPWGWAPYHYGRWFNGGLGWCWWPGPNYGRHFWAPAYVGFFGFGGGSGFGFGFGNVGWVALAPFERFHPWWGRGWTGRDIFENSRMVNAGNVANTYRNGRVANGVTAVSASEFGRRGGAFASYSGSQIRNAGVVRGMPSITPGRSSLALSNRAASGNYPHTANRQFFSRSAAPAGQRSSFSGQMSGSHDWSRFGSPIQGSAAASGRQSGGWRAFGSPSTTSYSGSRGAAGYSQQTQPRYAEPNSSYGYRGGSAQPLRINPSIVQQRAPSYSAPSYNGGGRSMPSYSAPSARPAAPSYNGGGRSAPSGGGRAPSGGGRSSGGGGHHR